MEISATSQICTFLWVSEHCELGGDNYSTPSLARGDILQFAMTEGLTDNFSV